MGDTALRAMTQKAADEARKQPIENRCSTFKELMASGWYKHQRIDVALMLAVILGGEEGISWFQQSIPLADRLNAQESLLKVKVSQKIKRSISKAYIGDQAAAAPAA